MKLKILWGYLSSRRKKQFFLLLILMVVASLTEIISIGAILPFLGALTAPEIIYQHELMQPIIELFNITSEDDLLLPLTLVFIAASILAGAIRLLLLYSMTRFSYATGADLSIDIYRRTLYQEYAVHVSRNSSEVINGIITKTGTVIGGVFSPTLDLISSALIITAILGTLFTIDTLVALSASIGFGIFYLGIVTYTKKQLKENSQCIADQSTKMIKSLQEGLGGIRDVLIDGSQQFYCQLYRNSDLPLRRASGNNSFIGQSPRYVIESLGMTLIAVIAYWISLRDGGLTTAIPILGALALGAQRLLPSLQQAYAGYIQIKGAHASLSDVLELLNQPLPGYIDEVSPVPMTFEKYIKLTNLSFSYLEGTPWVFDNVNLQITKGSRIGFIGLTGSGKSTLLDIIMGLLAPTEGNLIVDNEAITYENRRFWQAHIAHVPQNIYLSDTSIEENIAFGIPEEQINHEQVRIAAKKAQISDLIEDLPEQYKTFVGERGIRLSGGQKQRIGVARALYKDADVLIFDEATSALDNETEQALMDAINNLDKELTILIIAHRLTSLSGCDQVVEFQKNGELHIKDYREVI